jgi:ribosomal protein S19E (S16A)
VDYYWSVFQSEWATDIMFRDKETLEKLYHRLVQQGITRFQCSDVLRFLGKKLAANGNLPGHFTGQVTSDLKERPEGIRLKHRVDGNSVKLYDKQGTVLRAETTMNEPSAFKVYRTAEGQDDSPPTWRPMRKGVADLRRRTELSQAVNDRYLNALASIEDCTPLGELTGPLCRPTNWKGRRVRALHPWSPDDLDLLRAIGHGDFLVRGLRNAEMRQLLYTVESNDPAEQRRRSATITRKIRLLRAHGLLAKRPRSHRYMVTPKGNTVISALLAAHHASADSLAKLAA